MDSITFSEMLGFASLLVFVVPAIAIASNIDRVQRFVQMEHSDAVDPRLRGLKQELDRTLLQKLREWSPWHSRLMYLGYALAVASYLVKFLA